MPTDDPLVPRRPDQHTDPCGATTGEVVTVAAFGGRRMPMPDPLVQRARAAWSVGDCSRIAAGYATGAAAFVDALALAPGEATLDVACGTGALALPAARAGAAVVGVDFAPNVVDVARAMGARERLAARFDEGDAEALPYADASFTTVMSMFGVMFALRPERALAELFRVARPRGRIALASWTPEGFGGALLRAHAEFAPPLGGVEGVLGWGEPEVMRARLAPFTPRIRGVAFTERTIEVAYPLSPAGVVELFRECYAPVVRAFGVLGADARALLWTDLLTLWQRHNIGPPDFTRVEATYLEVRIELA